MKTCSMCKEELPLDSFSKANTRKDGRQTACKPCAKELRVKNKEIHKAASLRWRENNPEAHRALMNKASRKWNKANPGMKNAATARRRARLLNATPEWANEEAISFVYHAAQVLKDVYGTTWHVDHKVPLAGASVCGLHVADNLQLLSPDENLRKSNKWRG